MPVKVLVLFYSTYGHMYTMAKAAAEGVQAAGAEAVVKRVAETLPVEVLEKMHAVEAQKAFVHVPVATVDELGQYDAIILGNPTRFGLMSAQMKTFWDATGQLWMQGALVGKVGSVMSSSATQHGGNEATILSTHIMLLHHGMIIVGLAGFQGVSGVEEVSGCTPYGASTIAGSMGQRMPSENELNGARHQGKHVATIATKLAKP